MTSKEELIKADDNGDNGDDDENFVEGISSETYINTHTPTLIHRDGSGRTLIDDETLCFLLQCYQERMGQYMEKRGKNTKQLLPTTVSQAVFESYRRFCEETWKPIAKYETVRDRLRAILKTEPRPISGPAEKRGPDAFSQCSPLPLHNFKRRRLSPPQSTTSQDHAQITDALKETTELIRPKKSLNSEECAQITDALKKMTEVIRPKKLPNSEECAQITDALKEMTEVIRPSQPSTPLSGDEISQILDGLKEMNQIMQLIHERKLLRHLLETEIISKEHYKEELKRLASCTTNILL